MGGGPAYACCASVDSQVLVVVTAGLEVLCYDHNLKLMWTKDVSNGQLLRHSRVKEVRGARTLAARRRPEA